MLCPFTRSDPAERRLALSERPGGGGGQRARRIAVGELGRGRGRGIAPQGIHVVALD